MFKIAVLIANGSEDIEVVVPVDLWRRAGLRVDLISVEKKKICILSNGNKISADNIVSKVNLSQYNALYIPGGPGHERIKIEKKVVSTLPKFFSDPKKYLLSACAATSIYGEMGFLDKVKATGYPGTEKSYSKNFTNEPATSDKNFITGKSPGTIFDFSLLAIEKFIGKKERNSLEKEIHYKE